MTLSELLRARGGDELIEALESLIALGRSPRFVLRRHLALHGAEYRAALDGAPAADAARARALLAGRARVPSEAALAAAIAREPKRGLWRTWRAVSRLSAAKRGDRKELVRGGEDALAGARLSPDSALSCAVASVAERARGRLDSALALADAAVRARPGEGWLLKLRGECRLLLGDGAGFGADVDAAMLADEGLADFDFVKEVLEERRELREAAVASHWYWGLRGNARRSPEFLEPAGGAEDLARAAALGPDRAWVLAYHGRAQLFHGPEAARGPLERAVELAPERGWLRAWLGEFLRRSGRGPAARRELDAAARLDPNYELAFGWRGALNLAEGRAAEAAADLERSAALADHAWVLHQISLARRAAGRWEDAYDALERALALDSKFAWPGDGFGSRGAWPRALKGRALLEAGDARRAERELAGALKLAPRHGWARAWRGAALASLGRGAEAAQELARAVKALPRSGFAWAWRGRVLDELGRGPQARAAFDRAVALEPTAAWARCWKARADARAGRLDDARRELEAARSLDPRNPELAELARALTP